MMDVLTDLECARVYSAYTTRNVIHLTEALLSVKGLVCVLHTKLKGIAELICQDVEVKAKINEIIDSLLCAHRVAHTEESIRRPSTKDSEPKIAKDRKRRGTPPTTPTPQSYTCEECGYSTVRRGDYNKHILIHTDIRPYQCPLCDYKTTEKCRLNRHMKSKLHTAQPMFHKTRNKKKVRYAYHIKCDRCLFACATVEEMLTHKSLKHPDSTSTVPDTIHTQDQNTCPSQTLIQVIQHSQCDSDRKRKGTPFSCPTPQSYVCEKCGYSTVRRGDYNKHILIHTDIRPHQCPHCDYKATEKWRLIRHMKSKLHTGQPSVNESEGKQLPSDIKCDSCLYTCHTLDGMLTHKFLMHPDSSLSMPCSSNTHDQVTLPGHTHGQVSQHTQSSLGSDDLDEPAEHHVS